MKALVLKEYNKLVIENVPEPKPGEDEVLIRVKACGICGSDVHGMDGSTGRRIPPIVMGHEASGVVEDMGKRVVDLKKGDRVTFDSTVYCGICYYCMHGQTSTCDNRKVLGVSCGEYRMDGAFAEYVAVPRRIIYPIPDSVSFERAAMVEPLSVAFHGIELTPKSLNDTAVVLGAGMIGVLTVQGLRIAGYGKIIVVDIDRKRLDMAVNLGADHAIQAGVSDVVPEVLKITGGRGADAAFEAVGHNDTVNTGIDCLRKGGSITLIGNFSPKVEMPLQKVVARQIRLYGSYASSGEYAACLDMIGRGAVNIDVLLSAKAPLVEGPAWFKKLYNREDNLLKVILEPA